MKNINVENKARYTAIYFAGDEVGAIYVGVKNTEGKPFNLVIFRKTHWFDSFADCVNFADSWFDNIYLDWFNNYLTVKKMASDYNIPCGELSFIIEQMKARQL